MKHFILFCLFVITASVCFGADESLLETESIKIKLWQEDGKLSITVNEKKENSWKTLFTLKVVIFKKTDETTKKTETGYCCELTLPQVDSSAKIIFLKKIEIVLSEEELTKTNFLPVGPSKEFDLVLSDNSTNLIKKYLLKISDKDMNLPIVQWLSLAKTTEQPLLTAIDQIAENWMLKDKKLTELISTLALANLITVVKEQVESTFK